MGHFIEGTQITLEGISKRGKQKVKAHGNNWKFIKEGSVAFAKGTHILLESLQDESRRWVKLLEDCDFSFKVAS